jgi:hypothetical protein
MGWRDQARCKGLPASMFVPSLHTKVRAYPEPARRACAQCSVRQECLDWAVANNEEGYWGGTTSTERDDLRASTGVSLVSRPSVTMGG